MCDYSLHTVRSRPAEVGDKLITTRFSDSITRGFSAPGEPNAFDKEAECKAALGFFASRKLRANVARFRQINMDQLGAHHDALEFPGGQIVLVTRLCEGQHATVIQLPASARVMNDAEPQRDVLIA
jgi:hypothetical protein